MPSFIHFLTSIYSAPTPCPTTMLGTEDPRIEHAHRPEGATYIQITVIVTYVPNKDKFKAL